MNNEREINNFKVRATFLRMVLTSGFSYTVGFTRADIRMINADLNLVAIIANRDENIFRKISKYS